MSSLLRCMGFSRTESLLGLAIIGMVLAVGLPPMKAHLQQEKGQSAGITARLLTQENLDYPAETTDGPPSQMEPMALDPGILSGPVPILDSEDSQDPGMLVGAMVTGDDIDNVPEGTP